MNDESRSRAGEPHAADAGAAASGLSSRLQARLDGSLTAEELALLERELAADPRAAAEALAFARLSELATRARVTAPAGFSDRVMNAIAGGESAAPVAASARRAVDRRALPGERRTLIARLFGEGFAGGAGWLRPGLLGALALVTVAVAAALLFVKLEGRRAGEGSGPGQAPRAGSNEIAASSGSAADSTSLVVHRFVLEAPGAQKVCLVGDFNAWKLCEVPMKQDSAGRWSVELNLPRGRHQYMFVVDDREWQTDPDAGVRIDDGFGNQNAVLFL